MESNEMTIGNEMDQLVSAFNDDDTATFMELTGQAKATSNVGLPRLNINYDTETDDGTALTRGSWKMFPSHDPQGDGDCIIFDMDDFEPLGNFYSLTSTPTSYNERIAVDRCELVILLGS